MSTSRRGIARTIEAVFAVFLILAAFSFAYALAPPPNPRTVGTAGDVERVGYDILARLAQGNAYSSCFFLDGGRLYIASYCVNLTIYSLNALVPGNYVYNLTLYGITQNATWVQNQPLFQDSTNATIPLITDTAGGQFGIGIGYVAKSTYVMSLYLYNPSTGDYSVQMIVFELQLGALSAL